ATQDLHLGAERVVRVPQQRLEPEVPAVPLRRAIEVGDREPDVVHAPHPHANRPRQPIEMNSSWMLSGSRNTSTEDAPRSLTGECSTPSSMSRASHASNSARSATKKLRWSSPVLVSENRSRSFAEWVCSPTHIEKSGLPMTTA